MATITSSCSSKLPNSGVHYLNEASADVFFVCGSNEATERVPAHRIILALNSDVFNTMFYGSLPEEGDVTIIDITPNGFREFLRYFYFTEYTPDLQYFRESMTLARKYLIEHYFSDCCTFLEQQETAKGIIFAYTEALWFDLKDLRITLEEKMVKERKNVLGSKYLHQIDADVLKQIIQIKNMQRYRSSYLFRVCMAWSKEACSRVKLSPTMQDRREQLSDCFESINFTLMTADQIIECIEQFDGLFTVQELQELAVIAGSKYQGKSTVNDEYECIVGGKTESRVTKGKDSQEQFQFIPRKKMVLGGIGMPEVYRNESGCNSGIINVAIIKIPPGKDICDGTVLHKSTNAEGNNVDDIILQPNSVYVIQISFKDECYYDAGEMIQLLDDAPITVLSQTNTKMIHSLYFYDVFKREIK